jgi:opacity protein-like surface antigen
MNFAWTVGVGVGYAWTPRLTMELAYKYLDIGQVRNGATLTAGGASFQLTPSKTGDLGVHAVTVGLRYGL